MWRWLAATAVYLALPAAAQTTFDALKASGEITNDVSKGDLAAAAEAASRLMEGPSAEKLKGVFRVVSDLGRAQYTDLVYARDYGQTEKDVIYKIDFDKAFVFVRYLYHLDNGAWRLIHVDLKTENDLPFPKDWVHIYPK